MTQPVPWNWPPIKTSGGEDVGSTRPGAWLLAPPETPDSWDFDAALQTDDDLPSDWIVKYNAAPYTVLTRGGPIQPSDLAPMPPLGQYYSSWYRNRLVMQFQSGRGVEIFRPSSGPYLYWFHASPANWDGNILLTGFVAEGNNFDQAGNQITYFGRENGNVRGVQHIGPATFNISPNAVDPQNEFNADRIILMKDAGSGVRTVSSSLRYPNGVFWRAGVLGPAAAMNTSTAGLLYAGGNASGPNWLFIDSMRRLDIDSIIF